MKADNRAIQEVHVLRHTFRPSQPFEEAIEQFVEPGKTLPRFLLSGTKEVGLDSVEYHDLVYKGREDKARNEFQKLTEPIYIDPVMFYKFIGSSALRLAFIPTAQSQPAFNEALETLNGVPNILPPFEKTPRYFMYIDVPTTPETTQENVHEKYVALRKALASKTRLIYSVLPEDITGKDVRREVNISGIDVTVSSDGKYPDKSVAPLVLPL